MPMLTNLADVLRAAGLDVEEIPGWKTRGHTALGPMEEPTGILVHHTATRRSATSDYPSRQVILNGWPALPGPLAQLGIGYSGKVYVFAAGVCYHAGPTKDARYRNVRCIGIEAEHPGDSSPWPKAQYDAYVKVVAALQKAYPKTAGHVQGHKEQTAGKIDPTFNMNTFRADVLTAANTGATVGTKDKGTGGKAPTGFPVLTKGSTGAAVTKLQAWLLAMYPAYARPAGTNGKPDGSFGAGMERVVKEWQRRSGLTPDGAFGPKSLATARKQGFKP